MTSKILVTGPTGNVGRYVLEELVDSGQCVTAAVYNKEEATNLTRQVDWVILDFNDRNTFANAFNGIDRVFLMRPPQITDIKNTIAPAIDKAMELGVKHFVLLSLLGAQNIPFVPHRKIEKHIIKKKASYTFIRPSFFMQNLITTHREEIAKYNELRVPAGNGETSFIDCRDIAYVASIVLKDPELYLNKAYEITGAAALSYYEAANIMSSELGRDIKYTNPSMSEFKKSMLKRGVKKEFITVMQGIYTTARIGLAKKVTTGFKSLTGNDPISFRQFVKDYADFWR